MKNRWKKYSKVIIKNKTNGILVLGDLSLNGNKFAIVGEKVVQRDYIRLALSKNLISITPLKNTKEVEKRDKKRGERRERN